MKKDKNVKKKKRPKPMEEWMEANIERLVQKPGIKKFFGLTDDNVAEFLETRQAQRELREGDVSSVESKLSKIRYSEKEIMELVEQLDWNGKGTENDPIIIPNSTGLPQEFFLSITKLFIKIMNCQFDSITLDNCQKISIENCSFEFFSIIDSSEINVNNSTIVKLILKNCSKSYFKESAISNALNVKSKANIFEDCLFTKKVRKKLQESISDLSRFVKQFPYVILISGIGISIFTLIHLIDSVPFGFNWFLMIGAFFCLIVLYLILLKTRKKSTPNKIIFNQNYIKHKGV